MRTRLDLCLLLAALALCPMAALADAGTVDGQTWNWIAVGPPEGVPAGEGVEVRVRLVTTPALEIQIAGVQIRGRQFQVLDFSAPVPLPDGGLELCVTLQDGVGPGLYGVALDVSFHTPDGEGTSAVNAEVRVGKPATDAVAPRSSDSVEAGPVLWTVAPPAKIVGGEPADFIFDVVIEPPYHIYSVEKNPMSVPTIFSLPAELGEVVEVVESPAHSMEESWGSWKQHAGKARFRVRAVFRHDLAGAQTVPFTVSYQTCTETSCDPQAELLLQPQVFAVAGAAPVKLEPLLELRQGPTHWTLEAPASVAPGGVVELALALSIDVPYHIYSVLPIEFGVPTTLEVDPALGELVSLRESSPKFHKDDFTSYSYHEGTAEFRLQLRLAEGLSGVQAIPLKVGYQLCTDQICEPPVSIELVAVVELKPTAEEPASQRGPYGKTRWTVRGPKQARAGEVLTVHVDTVIDAQNHIYGLTETASLPTSFSVPAALGSLEVSETAPQAFDNALGKYEAHEGSARFTLKLRLADTLKGTVSVPITARYQVCDARLCSAPQQLELTHIVQVAAAASGNPPVEVQPAVGDPPAVVNPPAEPGADSSQAVASTPDKAPASLWAFLLRVIGYALITLVMPCTYPMIPITISIFTKGENVTRAQSMTRAGVYGLGIICAYTGVAGLVQIIFGAAGQNFLKSFALNPWVNLAIGAAFIYFAFSFLGYFEIQLPGFIQNFVSKASSTGKVTYGGIFLMGLFFMLTSYSCGAPLVLNVFAEAAALEGYESFSIILAFLVFSSVLALPFFFLALLPSMLKSMPRSGGWFNTVKAVLGFAELAFALKFLSVADIRWGMGLLTRPVFLLLWIGCLGVIVLYLLRIFRLPHDGKQDSVSFGGMTTVLFCMFCMAYLGSWFTGQSLQADLESFLPPHPYPSFEQPVRGSGGNGELQPDSNVSTEQQNYDQLLSYHHTFEAGRAAARAEGKRHFVMFTGYFCQNCRRMESSVLKAPRVLEALKGMVRTALHTDSGSPDNDANNELLIGELFGGTASLPDYYVLDAEGNVLNSKAGAMSEEEFLALLNSGN